MSRPFLVPPPDAVVCSFLFSRFLASLFFPLCLCALALNCLFIRVDWR